MVILVYLIISCLALLIDPEANKIVGDTIKDYRLSVKNCCYYRFNVVGSDMFYIWIYRCAL